MIVPPTAPSPMMRPYASRDDRIWNAKQQAEDQSYEPTGPREPGGTDYKADPESGNECSRECGLFIRERHRKHDSDIRNSENQATNCPELNSRHDIPSENGHPDMHTI